MRGEIRRHPAFHLEPLELVKSVDIQAQLLPKELAKARNLEGAAHPQNGLELDASIHVFVVRDRSLNILEKIPKNGPHGLHDLLGILATGRLLLQPLRLGIWKFERLHDRFREVAATDREGPDPALIAVNDHQITGLGTDIQHHERLVHAAHQIKMDRVEERHRAEVDDSRLEAVLAPDRQAMVKHVLLDRKDSDFGLRRILRDELFGVPFDLFDRKRNLLCGFKLNDVGNLLLFDRRQFCKSRQRRSTLDAHHHRLVLEILLARECPERETDHLIDIEVRRAQRSLVRIFTEVRHDDLIARSFESECFYGVGTDFDAPCSFASSHAIASLGISWYRLPP